MIQPTHFVSPMLECFSACPLVVLKKDYTYSFDIVDYFNALFSTNLSLSGLFIMFFTLFLTGPPS